MPYKLDENNSGRYELLLFATLLLIIVITLYGVKTPRTWRQLLQLQH